MTQEINSKLEKFCLYIIYIGTALALFTPFIFLREYFFPFVVPKTIFFRVIVDIIFIVYLILIIFIPRYRPKFNIFIASVTIFLLILVITAVTGVNFERSFWSTFERMTGLLTFFHLYAFFIILVSVFKKRIHWEIILTISMLVGILICFYTWTSEETATRGGGTVGNTSFLAAYLLFNIFFALILLLTKERGWKVFYGLVLITLLAGLFVSDEPCRGAIGAFWGGLFIMGFGFLLFYLFSSGRRGIAFIILAFIILGVFGALQLDFIKDKIAGFWQSGSLQSRMVVWKMSFEGWKERLWLGWGLENFNIPFAKHFDSKLPLTRDIWYDRVHNIVLDIGVTSGILGLVGYLSIFGIAIWKLVSIIPKVTKKINAFFPLGAIALLLVYFAQNIWVFDMISSYMMFFLSLAFVNFLISQNKEYEHSSFTPKSNLAYRIVGFLLISITIVTFYFGNVQTVLASRYTVMGLFFPLEQSVYLFQEALKSSPMAKFETSEQFATRMVEFGFASNQNQELLQEGIKLAEEELKKSIKDNPLDFRFYLFLGKYYNNIYKITSNPEKTVLAEEWLLKSKDLSPRNQQVYWNLGQTYLFQKRFNEAFKALEKAIELEPRYGLSHWYLGLAYKIANENELAAEQVQKAIELGYNWKGNMGDLNQVIEIYTRLNNQKELVSLYEKAVELSPKDVQLWAHLADSYAAINELEKAKAAAEKILELDPNLSSQVEEFLKSIGY